MELRQDKISNHDTMKLPRTKDDRSKFKQQSSCILVKNKRGIYFTKAMGHSQKLQRWWRLLISCTQDFIPQCKTRTHDGVLTGQFASMLPCFKLTTVKGHSLYLYNKKQYHERQRVHKKLLPSSKSCRQNFNSNRAVQV